MDLEGELELYAYTTEAYEQIGLIKVGHCKVGRYKKRIGEQFSTSNPEKPIFELIGALPVGIQDYNIHAQLIKNGCKKVELSPGKEWFYGTFVDVKKAYNQVVYGVPRKHNYELRKEQADAVDKAKKWFLKEYPDDIYRSATFKKRFLMNAKMRFGKCFTSVSLAKTLNCKNTLIITYKPDVIDEWIETVNEHVSFNGWVGVRAKAKRDKPNDPVLTSNGAFPKNDGVVVLCVSLQDLSIDASGRTKERLSKVIDVDWDLIIFDEVHYGSRTDRAEHILNNLKFSKRLDLSGTPFRIIEQDDYSCQQVYTYSYLDEQKNKKNEIINDAEYLSRSVYRQLPDLDISTIEVTYEDINQQIENLSTDDLDFSLNRLFETNDGVFIHEDSVDHFLEGLTKFGHEARSVSVFGKLGSSLGVPNVRHTVWWLKRVDSIAALSKKLRSHPYFSKFEVINASGSGGKSDDDKCIAREKSVIQEKINEVTHSSDKLGTITLTCGRFLTGITIKEWDSILILNDVQSAESYFQAIFRVQSPWYEQKSDKVIKPKAWVFDFAITRCLKIIYDCANCISDQLDQQESYNMQSVPSGDNLEFTTSGLCETLDIKRFVEGALISDPVTSKEIFEVLNHEGSRLALARRITSNALVNFGSLKLLNQHPHLLDILKKVKGYRTQDVSSMDIKKLVEIGMESEKLEELKMDPDIPPEEKEEIIKDFIEKDKDKERQKRKKWYATQIKRLAICMADFIYMTYEREYNLNDVIQTKSPEFFHVMTGITKDDFNLLCEYGFLNRFALNRIVKEFRDQETSSLNPEEFIHEAIKKMLQQ
jgi:hypothetical protein